MIDIVERLRAPSNWLRQDKGSEWKSAINHYDRTPFDAADEITRLRAALELYREAVRIDATMEGPKFMGSNASALKRAWEADLAALGGKDE